MNHRGIKLRWSFEPDEDDLDDDVLYKQLSSVFIKMQEANEKYFLKTEKLGEIRIPLILPIVVASVVFADSMVDVVAMKNTWCAFIYHILNQDASPFRNKLYGPAYNAIMDSIMGYEYNSIYLSLSTKYDQVIEWYKENFNK